MDLMVCRPPFLLTGRLARLCRYSRRAHVWLPSGLIRQLVDRLQIHRGLRLCRRPELIAHTGASRKSAPASGEKLGRGARNGALSLPAVACVLLFDATRCATITETRCERVLFPRPYRPPQPCRTACRLRSGMIAR